MSTFIRAIAVKLQAVSLLFLVLAASPVHAQVERTWLPHRTNDPSQIVVNWMSTKPGESVVRLTSKDGTLAREVRLPGQRTLHHVEVPLGERDGVCHYIIGGVEQG